MVIFSEDFSIFTHAHPKFLGVAGDFYLGVNQEDDDVDSLGTAQAISMPGKYHMIMEIFPDVGSLMPVPVFINVELIAKGDSEKIPLVFDQKDSQCVYNKYLTQFGQPGRHGNTYRIRLDPGFVPGVGGTLIKFHFFIDRWDTKEQTYYPAQNLQTFMRMSGHLFLLRFVPKNLEVLGYSHLHGMMHTGRKGMIMTTYFDRGEILYDETPIKLWFQFKHEEKVQVVSFIVNLDPRRQHGCSEHFTTR